MPTCDICGAPSNGYECDWPMERFVTVSASQIVVGDTVTRMRSARQTSSVAKVAFISKLTNGQIEFFLAIQTPKSVRRLQIRTALGAKFSLLEFEPANEVLLKAWGAARFKHIHASPGSSMRAIRTTTCSKHVCDACMIERDANRMVICKEHWNAWQEVA